MTDTLADYAAEGTAILPHPWNLLALAVIATLAALLLHHVVFRLLRRVVGRTRSEADEMLVRRLAMPTRFALVALALVVLLLGLGLSLSAFKRYKSLSEDELILPSKTWNVLAFFDLIVETLLNTMESMMPRKDAIAALPLITSFALFILMCNLLGMVPGFLPATDNLNTTAALASVCFLAYNFWGFKKQGVVKYLQHFASPIWWLSWFMFPLEIISHLARPLSLAVRLMGNMFGDHLVLGIILSFGILVMPLPVMLLGMIVCFVQTAVFTLLAIVYVALAVEEHHHDDEHHHGEAAAH